MKIPVLNDLHEQEGARLVEFAGWRMPVSFAGILKETDAVRTAAGLFDVTHMGRLRFTGKGVLESLQNLLTNDVSRLADMQGQYTLLCNDNGGVIDDTILYRESEDTFYLIVNASNTSKDKEWIQWHLAEGVVMDDITPMTAMFALQGPSSIDIMSRIGVAEAAGVKRFAFTSSSWHGGKLAVARTGYTGEDGFELICSTEDAERLWNAILEAGSDLGILRCGLGSRDVLRIEAGYPLYGNELDEHTSPVEAGLMRFVKMDKGDFIGREAVERKLAEPSTRKLAGLVMESRAIPRSGEIMTQDSENVGVVTSGTWSPTFEKGIGMAYMRPDKAVPGTHITIQSRGRIEPGEIVSLPIYKRG